MSAFQATYKTCKPIVTRGVVQLIFEVPTEAWPNVCKYLPNDGMPPPGDEPWYGIARLEQPNET